MNSSQMYMERKTFGHFLMRKKSSNYILDSLKTHICLVIFRYTHNNKTANESISECLYMPLIVCYI